MKIKLISPKMTLRPMDSEFKRLMSPSLSLLIVAGLTPPEHEVTIADENLQPLNLDDHPDLVGINVNVDTSTGAYRIAKHYRSRGIPVVLGGIHVSANPEEGLRHADAVCIGAAEGVWERMILDAQEHRLHGPYHQELDMTQTPLPRWDLIDTQRYLYSNVICTSRGCPWQCDFCYNSCEYMQGHHTRPVQNVIREIHNLGTKQVLFIDDNLIGNIAWTHSLLAAMKPLGLTWHAAVSANLIQHLDLLDEMAASGCQSLFIGFESINAASLEGVNKQQNNVEVYESLIKEIHDRGMMVSASLVFGLDQDRPDVFEHTLDWLVRNKIETMTAHILTPYPGTRLFERLQQQNRITDYDWTHYNTSRVVFQPKHMTPEELRTGYLKLYRDFYSIKNIIKRLPSRPQQRKAYLLLNLGYRKFGKIAATIVTHLGLMHLYGRVARHLAYGI